ncbi:hypothetical protein IA69_01115 [Massilia sp. JS1662]|nr:AAA family ATPase [Massilia sp. JS1662]KGF83432.1 hypothetical protein IA69_01115 [Massilia sp. JS1662]
MKTDVRLLAYFYRDRSGDLRAVRFTSEWRPEVSNDGARVVRAVSPLPAGFFSEHITSIAALVGKNSAGKSTIIEDICRVLTGRKTKASASCLVCSCNEGRFGLGTPDFAVVVDGETLEIEERNTNKQLHAYYYSSGIEPFGRHGELVKDDGSLGFTDISSQTVFTTDLLEDDFSRKIDYLSHVLETGQNTLELGAEHGRPRSIKFICSLPYDVEESAQAVVRMMLTSLPANDQRRTDFIDELTRQDHVLREVLEEALSSPPPFLQNSRLLLPDRHYFEFLAWYLRRTQGESQVFEEPGTFRLIVGAMADTIKWDDPERFQETAAKFAMAWDNLDGCVGSLLGPPVLSSANALFRFLESSASRFTPLAGDYTTFEIEISGDSAVNRNQLTQLILHHVQDLRSRSVRWSFEFSGISEGQKTLLTFYSRLYHAMQMARTVGNAVILIDEHETGLHPEWQRRYLKELIDFIGRENKLPTRVQVLLSTHSPFVVSDLPAQLVNIVDPGPGARQETFAANLLDLLLSPVFMDKSTGEFAASKIRELLAGVADAQRPEDVEKLRGITQVVGDRMTKNFCNQKMDEKIAALRRDHDKPDYN